MKIFVDAYLLNNEYQGTRTYIVEIYKEIVRLDKENNYEITFGIDFLTQEIVDEFIDFPRINFYEYKNKNKWLRRFTELPILSKEYDFMHFQYLIPFRKLNKKCKYITTIHDVLFIDYPKEFPLVYRLSRKVLFKWSAKKADVLLTVSNYSKEKISEHFRISPKNIFITPNGVSELFFEDYNKKLVQEIIKQKYKISDYMLYISRIEPRKNQYQLLKLFAENKEINTKYQLVFVGKKSLQTTKFDLYYESLSEDLKNKIVYIEQVPNQELVNFYRAASFFVYPTLFEGFGIPILEAAACKIPSLCNDKTAMQDFDFLSPYLVNFEDQNINQIFNDFVLKNQSNLVEIKKKVQNEYTWTISSKNYINIINSTKI